LIVLDASLMIAWLLREPELAPTTDLYLSLPQQTVIVPGHWPLEVGTALWANVRRGRLPMDRLSVMMEELATFEIQVQSAIQIEDMETLTRFAVTQNLTVYDSAYVQLAERLGLPLATLDNAMRSAAAALSIPLLPVAP
jgi:predicted nucleic acid-binding protein